jgi:hypothetical protein
MSRWLPIALLLCGAPAFAQNPVSIAQVGATPVTTTLPVAGSGSAGVPATGVVTVQGITSGTLLSVNPYTPPAAITYLVNRLTDGTNYLTPGSDYTQDAALTVASTTGPLVMCRASAAAPTDVTADNDAVMTWCLRSGAAVHQPSFAGVLASTGTGAVGTGSQRVAVGTDTATIAGSAPGTAGTASANVVTVQGIASMTAVKVDGSAVSQPVTGTVGATQSGTWTVQPGNTANTTPWLATVSQGGNAATVTAGNALKVDGSAVTQPVSIAATVATSEVAPTTVLNGNRNVTTAGTRVTLTAGSTTAKGVTICAKTTNTGNVFVGDSSVSSSTGRILIPGECQSLAIANLQTVNLDSAVNGEGVTYLGVN